MNASENANFFNLISNLLSIRDIIFFLAGAGFGVAFLAYLLKREWTLFLNLRRPIMIFKSSKNDMEIETKLLRDAKIFNIPEEPTDKYQNLDRIKDHGLVIVGYSNLMNNFNNIFEGAINAGIPIIVYSKNTIPKNVFNRLRSYSWYSTCQVPLRLLNDVFTILSTFPNKR